MENKCKTLNEDIKSLIKLYDAITFQKANQDWGSMIENALMGATITAGQIDTLIKISEKKIHFALNKCDKFDRD